MHRVSCPFLLIHHPRQKNKPGFGWSEESSNNYTNSLKVSQNPNHLVSLKSISKEMTQKFHPFHHCFFLPISAEAHPFFPPIPRPLGCGFFRVRSSWTIQSVRHGSFLGGMIRQMWPPREKMYMKSNRKGRAPRRLTNRAWKSWFGSDDFPFPARVFSGSSCSPSGVFPCCESTSGPSRKRGPQGGIC